MDPDLVPRAKRKQQKAPSAEAEGESSASEKASDSGVTRDTASEGEAFSISAGVALP
jgi:hypothetical protein